MKKVFYVAALPVLLIVAACTGNQSRQTDKPEVTNNPVASEVVYTDMLKFNEAVYAYDGGFLITNFGTDEIAPLNTEGKGYVVYLKDGVVSPFIPADFNLNAPKGMVHKGDYLFIADVGKVAVYNMKDTTVAFQNIAFPAGNEFVNDLDISGNTLYASVTNTGNIFTVDISDLTKLSVKKPKLWTTVPGANGIELSGNSMYVASYPASGTKTDENVVYVIKDVANPSPEVFFNQSGFYDGIALSEDGKTLYVSHWEPNGITAIDVETQAATPIAIETAMTGAAEFALVGNKIYLPDLGGKVIVKEIK